MTDNVRKIHEIRKIRGTFVQFVYRVQSCHYLTEPCAQREATTQVSKLIEIVDNAFGYGLRIAPS